MKAVYFVNKKEIKRGTEIRQMDTETINRE